VADSEIHQGRKRSDTLHEPAGDGRRDQRSRSETAYRDASNEAAPVRKPLHENRYRDNETHAQPDPSHHTVGQIQPPQLVSGKTSQKYAAAPQETGDHSNYSGAAAI